MTPPLTPRATYGDIKLYAPDRRVFDVDLSDNTNRWGAPPSALRELRAALDNVACRYPTGYGDDLKDALAEYAGVEQNMIVTGCGSDDVLDLAIRAFSIPGETLAMIAPTFVMIPSFARMNGLVCASVPLTDAYDMDADALIAEKARITYLCSPNNPTGGMLSRNAIERVLEHSTGLVIVDEAYCEFASTSVVDLVSRFPRLLVARTMSKAFGLAGFRVGYGIGDPALITAVDKSRGPYKVSAMAERAAAAVLRQDMDWVREHAALAVSQRERLAAELRARDIGVAPSSSNFVFAPLANAAAIAEQMRARGVSVRDFTGLPTFSPALRASGGSALRITVGPAHEIDAVLAALDEARTTCA